MTRPVSHRDQPHERSCGNCIHAHLVAYKLDLLCFHGDAITVDGTSEYPIQSEYILMDGQEVGMLDGDAYDRVWAGRVVNEDEICDDWQGQPRERLT